MDDIQKYLTSDERILEQWQNSGDYICATNKRIFIAQGENVLDISYPHISSIEIVRGYHGHAIMIGLLFLLGSIAFFQFNVAGGVLSIILAIASFALSRKHKIKMYVAEFP